MEENNQKMFFENIKKNSKVYKLQTIINNLKNQGDLEFINKYYSEKRTPLICTI